MQAPEKMYKFKKIEKTPLIIFRISTFHLTFALLNAQVAKLVDALCSGRSVRKDVLVRIQSWALTGFFPNSKTVPRN